VADIRIYQLLLWFFITGRHYRFSNRSGTSVSFLPEGNISFFSTAPTTIAFDGGPAFADNQVKKAIKKGE